MSMWKCNFKAVYFLLRKEITGWNLAEFAWHVLCLDPAKIMYIEQKFKTTNLIGITAIR